MTWTEIRYAGMREPDRYFTYSDFKKRLDGSIDSEGLREDESTSLVKAREQMRNISKMFTDQLQDHTLDHSIRAKMEKGSLRFFV